MLGLALLNMIHVWPQIVVLLYAFLSSVTALTIMNTRQATLCILEALMLLGVLYAGGFFAVLHG